MKKILMILLTTVSIASYSQKVKLTEGSLSALKGQTTIQVEFTYNDMEVGKDNLKEADYIKRKKEDYNSKEPGRGETWEKAWYADRKERFEPKFIELFEKTTGKKVNGTEPKYKLN
jgi:hypothetical protein